MFNKKIAMVGMSMMMAVSSIAPATVFAAGETTTEATSKETSKETSNKQNGKPTEEEKQQMKAKMEAAVSKWDKLSAEKKAEVYKLLEEEKAVKIKVLDKMVSLGVMDEADAKEVKTRMEERFAKMKESGKFPLGRPCPKHDKKDSNKEKNDD